MTSYLDSITTATQRALDWDDLPEELLPGVSAPALALEPERALPAIRVLLRLADCWYQEGLEGIRFLPLRTAFAIAVAGKVYQAIGHKLLRNAARDPAAAFRSRTVVSLPEKLIVMLTAVLLVTRIQLLKFRRSERKAGSVSSPGRGQP